MSTPLENSPLSRDPYTDPNLALRNFNAYFGKLRKDYGEDAIRAAGITPRVLAEIQATLRKVQMDPRATPEQHRQADRDANAMLVQKMTSPLTRPAPATQTVAASELDALERANKPAQVVAASPFAVTPEVEVRGVMPSMPETVRPVAPENAPFMDDYLKRLAASRAAQPTPPMPEMEVRPPMPVPSATDYIASMVTPPMPPAPSMAQPDVMPPTMLPMPMQPVGSPALLGDAPRPIDPSMVPSTAPGILPGITQQQPAAPSMNTQPGADFDRNVARQIFDSEFRTLREKYGDEGLRSAGLTPRTLASLQAPLTNVQRDNTISYDQSSAALEDALQKLRGYNFGGAQPAAPMQPAAPAPGMGGTLGGLLGGLLPKPPTNVVDPGMNIPADPNFRFGTSLQAPNPNAQGMALGGLINKYYR
jgi:hypothetical protein